MSTPTEIRKQLLANGYAPLPNLDKRCVLPEWPRVDVDMKEIERWARMRRYGATGIRVERGLCVIDLDVNDQDMLDAIVNAIFDRFPVLSDIDTALPVRLGKGAKEAWFVRTTETFSRLHTRRWVKPGETVEDGTHSVEIFGGGSPRQFGAYGAHTREDDGTVTVEYRWPHEHLLDTKLADLPVLSKAELAEIADIAEQAMREAGWTPVARTTAGESESQRVYDLTNDMTFDMADGRRLSLAQLKQVAAHTDGLRCSASWLEGETAVNTSRCLVTLTRAGNLAIWESAAGITHVEAEAEPRDFHAEVNRVAERLKELELKEKTTILRNDDCMEVAYKLREGYAYCPTARAPVVRMYASSIDDGVGMTNFRLQMLPHCMEEEGPRGGLKRINPVDVWMSDPKRVVVAGLRMRPDRERPTYEEDGEVWINTYKPADIGEAEDGDAAIGIEFMEQLLPDPVERAWFLQWLAYKYRHPWVPGPAVVMVAREFGTGRGTLGRLVTKLFGARYVKALPFHIFAGKSYQSQYNDWGAEALVAIVTESNDTGGQAKWAAKSDTYERLKDLIEPAPTERLFVRKGEKSFTGLSFTSYIIATNHIDALPIPENDRRFAILSNGGIREDGYWQAVNAWLMDDRNVAAFGAWLDAVDLSSYSPYARPPVTKAKTTMIDEAKSDLEHGMELALEALSGDVFTVQQVLNLMRAVQREEGIDYPEKWGPVAKKLLRQRAHRVGIRDGQNWKPMIDGKRVAVYALTERMAKQWTSAEADDLRVELLRSGPISNEDSNVVAAFFGRGR